MATTTPSVADPLVDDILIEIFILLAEKSRKSFRNIIAISHVCAQWRRVSLACPELWRRFAFLILHNQRNGVDHDLSFTNEILSRCGALTLDVGWEQCPGLKRSVGAITSELAYRHRLRTYNLPLHIEDGLWWSSVTQRNEQGLGVPGEGMAALEELSVSDAEYNKHYPSRGVRLLPSALSHYIFGDKLLLPELRTLRLKNLSVDMHTLSLPKLEVLDLQVTHDHHPYAPPRCILHTLQLPSILGITRLELRLRGLLKDPALSAQVVLPRLAEISLLTDFTSILLFLRHVSMPQCQKIGMHIWSASGELQPPTGHTVLSAIHQILRSLVTSSSRLPSKTLSVTHLDDVEMELIFSPRAHEVPHWARQAEPGDLTVIMGTPGVDRGARDIAYGVVAAWGETFGTVDCLELRHDPVAVRTYAHIFKECVRQPLGPERLLCSLEWARALVDGELVSLGAGRYKSVRRPIEVIDERSFLPPTSS